MRPDRPLDNSNPYALPTDTASDVSQRECLLATRGAIAAVAAAVMLYAASQASLGVFGLLTASPPSAELRDSPLFPPEMTEMAGLNYRDTVVRGAVQLSAGAVFAVVSVFLWRYRRRFSLYDHAVTDFEPFFRRLALYGFLFACVGVFGPVIFIGASSYVVALAISKCLACLTLLAFGVSCVALILGWELRISIGKSVLSYALGLLGAGLSGYTLVFMMWRFVREVSWRWQALV